jgi:hypothetical protein
MAGVDNREFLARQHRPVSARRSGGTHEGALLIGRMAWSLSLRIVNCGWLLPPANLFLFQRSDLVYSNTILTNLSPTPLIRSSDLLLSELKHACASLPQGLRFGVLDFREDDRAIPSQSHCVLTMVFISTGSEKCRYVHRVILTLATLCPRVK